MWRTYNFILKNAESEKCPRERREGGETGRAGGAGGKGSARKTVDKATRVPAHTLTQVRQAQAQGLPLPEEESAEREHWERLTDWLRERERRNKSVSE